MDETIAFGGIRLEDGSLELTFQDQGTEKIITTYSDLMTILATMEGDNALLSPAHRDKLMTENNQLIFSVPYPIEGTIKEGSVYIIDLSTEIPSAIEVFQFRTKDLRDSPDDINTFTIPSSVKSANDISRTIRFWVNKHYPSLVTKDMFFVPDMEKFQDEPTWIRI